MLWLLTSLASLAPSPPLRRVAPQPSVQSASSSQLFATKDATFRAWPALNDEATRVKLNAGRRFRLHLQEDNDDDPTLKLFEADTLMNRFGMALARRKAIDRKEFFEATEFFARVRSKVRADDGVGTLYDLAGGHGLIGSLFAIFMFEHFSRVIVRDPKKPKAFDAVVAAAVEVAPWVAGRISFEQAKVGPKEAQRLRPHGCAVVCVHGCRGLTDKIIAASAEADARSLALMPCCYSTTAADAPEALRLALGIPLAADVHRTYTLEGLGYTVKWAAIPTSISPMNRVIVAHRPAAQARTPADDNLEARGDLEPLRDMRRDGGAPLPRGALRVPHRPVPTHRAVVVACADGTPAVNVNVTVNVDGLRKEAQRVLYRAQKKSSKAEERAAACEAKQEALLADEDTPLEAFEALPNCDALRTAATEEAARLADLEMLVGGLKELTSDSSADDGSDGSLAELIQLAQALGVKDTPPERPPPKPKKPKGKKPKARLPYRVFRSAGGAEIRVGKQAKDNDVLSTDPAHRDGDDWWMHAAGCPGSHVVIRADSLGGSELPREVELDAAVLAANYSKATLSGSVRVSLCRARQVSKPFGAKAGLVQLSGDVTTVSVNWRKEKLRLERLRDALEG